MIERRVGNPSETKVAYFQIAIGVQQEIRRLQIAMENIRRMDVLQAAQDLIEEVADVLSA